MKQGITMWNEPQGTEILIQSPYGIHVLLPQVPSKKGKSHKVLMQDFPKDSVGF